MDPANSSPFWSTRRRSQLPTGNSHLNRGQQSVVEDVPGSPDRIQGVQGLPVRAQRQRLYRHPQCGAFSPVLQIPTPQTTSAIAAPRAGVWRSSATILP
jgi:hypothetical protein